MTRESWADGFRKVSKKARTGSGRKKTHAHGGHRKKLPTAYDAGMAVERRRRLNDLRAADLDQDEYDEHEDWAA